jgi:5-methylcytosine-specific restriction enzyme subunit McrC
MFSIEEFIIAYIPFLVNMSQLYERFVALWLKAHQEKALKRQALDIQSQERVYLGQNQALYFDIDLVIYDTATGIAKYVLDTK